MYLLCSKALRTVLGESFIHTRVIFEYTRHTKNLFRGFVPKLTMIDVFRTLLGFELFPAEILTHSVLGYHLVLEFQVLKIFDLSILNLAQLEL